MGKKFLTETRTRKVTDSTGNVVEETISKIYKVKSSTTEPFYMLYLNQLAWLYNITSVTAIKILAKFMENSDFNKGLVSVSTALRQDIMNELEISKSCLTQAIKSLVNAEALIETADEIVDKQTGEVKQIVRKGEYLINPALL